MACLEKLHEVGMERQPDRLSTFRRGPESEASHRKHATAMTALYVLGLNTLNNCHTDTPIVSDQ